MTDGIVRRMMARKVELQAEATAYGLTDHESEELHWIEVFLGDQPPGDPQWPADAIFELGTMVQKKGRASWRGKIVGWYRTELTALGFAVESFFEPGSVQIYPQTALIPWEPQ